MAKDSTKTRNNRGDIVFTFTLIALAYLAWQLRDLLILLYVSALFAVVLKPVVLATARFHIGHKQPFKGPIAILVLIVVLFGALAGFGFLALPPVIHDLQSFGNSTSTSVPDLVAKIKSMPFVGRLHLSTSDLYSHVQGILTSASTQAMSSVSMVAGGVASIVTGFVLTVYFMLEGDDTYTWCLHFFPHVRRERLDAALRRAEVGLGNWLRGQLSLMALLGLTSTTVFLLLDVRYAYALGVLTGLLNIVPVLGAALSLVLAVLVASLDSWSRVLGVTIFFLVYLQVENTFLVPRIMKARVGLPSLAIFIALLLGLDLAGIPGALVAVPTAVLVAVLLREYLIFKDEDPPVVEAAIIPKHPHSD